MAPMFSYYLANRISTAGRDRAQLSVIYCSYSFPFLYSSGAKPASPTCRAHKVAVYTSPKRRDDKVYTMDEDVLRICVPDVLHKKVSRFLHVLLFPVVSHTVLCPVCSFISYLPLVLSIFFL